jgi:hypothetical protein
MGTGNACGTQSVGPGPGDEGRGGLPGADGSQKETGGSGGEQLTRSLEDTGSAKPMLPVDAGMSAEAPEPEGAGSAATASTRGYQDTHGRQAGSTGTGLGAPETGGNQSPSDLAPKK